MIIKMLGPEWLTVIFVVDRIFRTRFLPKPKALTNFQIWRLDNTPPYKKIIIQNIYASKNHDKSQKK
jgi:hypothetical protein